MDDEYEYQPLPDEDSIRVLVLASGKYGEPLSGDLRNIRLSRRRRDVISDLWDKARRKSSSESRAKTPRWTPDVAYEAISYAWGSNVKDHTILLSGKVHHITAKLSDALYQCQLIDQPRVLWADSICIDQKSIEEKNHQVHLMSRIYASAQRTLICLGPDNQDHARDAFQVLSAANQMIQETFQKPDFSWKYDSFPWYSLGDQLISDLRWKSVLTLVHEPWFSRGWVVQEAALGREARMLWAGCEIQWLDFLRVYSWYQHAEILHWHAQRMLLQRSPFQRTDWEIPWLLNQAFIHQRPTEANVFLPEHQLDNLEILHALDLARSLSLTDPRDRIYAFMALPFIRSPVPALQPDYKQPYLELYRDFATKYLENTLDLNILEYVTHEESGEFPKDTIGSSWAPRWDRQAYTITPWPANTSLKNISLKNFNQRSTEPAEFTLIRGGDGGSATKVQVRAVIFDSIKLISPQFKESMTFEDLLKIWSHWTEQAGPACKDFDPSSDYDTMAFICALTHGFFIGRTDKHWSVGVKTFSSLLQNSVRDPASLGRDQLPITHDVQAAHSDIMSMAKDKYIFLLGRGYYGLGSWAIRLGDVCAFVKGVFSPLVLRKVPDDEAGPRHYKVIGPASVVSKKLNELGFPPVLHQWNYWGNWDEVCEWEGWTDWGLKEEQINLV